MALKRHPYLKMVLAVSIFIAFAAKHTWALESCLEQQSSSHIIYILTLMDSFGMRVNLSCGFIGQSTSNSELQLLTPLTFITCYNDTNGCGYRTAKVHDIIPVQPSV